MEITTQDVPEISPLRSVEQVQTAEKQIEIKPEQESSKEKTAPESISAKEVEEVLEAFQDLSETIQTKLSFSVDDNNNEIVVKVFDRESNELIRQFPSEEMLALQDKMTDLAGFLFNENV